MTSFEILRLVLSIILLIITASLGVRIGKHFRIPSVVVLIVFGIIAGFHAISDFIISDEIELFIELGDIGLVSLMFLAGMESDWKLLFKEKREAFLIAVFALIAPFLITMIVLPLLGFSFEVSFVVAVCLSISAEATRAKVLMELKKLKSELGAALIGAGIVDDVLGLSLFLMISLIFGTGHYSENILIILSIMAFFGGLFVTKCFGRKRASIKYLERALNSLFVPFFFISIGLRFDVRSLILNPFILFSIVVVAFLGKFIGAFATKPFLDLSRRQLVLVGWGMNSRGALGLAISLVAFHNELIHIELYSSLVLTAFLTTLAFPFVFYRMVGKNESIMGECIDDS